MKKLFMMWDEVWFSPRPLLNLGVFRFILAFTMGIMYISRQFEVGLFYSDAGMLPQGMALQVLPEFFRPSFLLAFWPDSWVSVVHLGHILGLFVFALGFGGRSLNWILAFLQLAFLQRNYSIAFGADQIGALFLLYLAFTNSCARFSLLNIIKARRPQFKIPLPQYSSDLCTHVGYRLIQVQLCVIYMFSGFEKLKGGTWWDGTALWTVLANPQMVVIDFTWLRYLPWVISLMTFSTVLFEIYFPVLVWFKKPRPFLLAAGAAFHFGIAFVMALVSFAAIMIAPYVLFIDEKRLQTVLSKIAVSK